MGNLRYYWFYQIFRIIPAPYSHLAKFKLNGKRFLVVRITCWDVQKGKSTGVAVSGRCVFGDDGGLLKGTSIALTITVPGQKKIPFSIFTISKIKDNEQATSFVKTLKMLT